jgi:hypothetical protein
MKKLIVLLALIVFTTPALALDLTQPLQTYDGKEFIGQDGKVLGLTADIVIQNALLSAPAADEADKKANYVLSVRIHEAAKDYTPTPDDIIRIRKALAATQATAVYGRVTSLLDPTFVPNK